MKKIDKIKFLIFKIVSIVLFYIVVLIGIGNYILQTIRRKK